MGEEQGDQPTRLPEQATIQGSETPTPVSVNTTENRLDQSPRPAQSHIARAATLPARRSLDTSKSKHIPGKVRFSSDIERVSPANYDAPTRQGLDAQRPPTATGLRINTDVESFPSVVSPNNGRVVSSGSAITNAPLSPPSPQSRTRDRGYSLRRTLFAKNIQTQSATETIGPSIELQTQRPSTAKTSVTQEKVSVVAEEEIRPVATLETDSQDEDGISLSYSESTPLKHTLSLTAGQNWLKATACKWKAYEYLDQWNEAIKEKVFRIKPLPPTKDGRHIELNVSAVDELVDERSDSSYVDNSIRSSRYSLWSFFPKQLIAQFSKVANFYFLVVSILQMIPGLSTTGTFTTIIPLLIFVGISMGKEGFDDLRRYRLDKEENNRYVHVLQPDGRRSQETKKSRSKDATPVLEDDGHWVAVKWRDVRVGDVIQLHRNQPVPADVVLLHAEGQNGVAHIETMALDGETNLKMKQPCQSVAKACKTPQDIIERRNLIRFTVEDPNIDLYKFDGNVTVNDEKLPITNTEILYRGSILRNTARIYAMVIYTGEECKIRMNANKNPRIKKPALQTVVNYVVVLIVAMVLLLAMICTIAYSVWDENYQEKAWYLTNATVAIGPVFTSYLIMFNTMIPISLYVSMEIVKVGQMLLLNDIDMYDEESDTPLEARTSTINEELGQVSYIFSDKTGTLTNNTMKFRMMSVAGTAWLHDSDLREEAARDADKHWLIHKKRSVKGKKAMSRKSGVESIHGASSIRMSMASAHDQPSRARSIAHGKPFRGGNTMQMLEYIQRKPHTLFARKAKFFILSLALCHTCIPEQDEAGNITYQAASPDEMALVTAAQQLGYLVMDRQQNTLTVRTYPSGHDDDPWDEVYEVLDVIEFTSARKRMSVIVRMPDQRICLFCKGADSIVTKLLRQASLAQQKAVQIERRASQRKAEEAFEVMRRNSEHQSPINVRNPSLSRRRSSGLTGKRDSLRRSVDIWLKDRETDGGMLNRDNGDEYYSPRPSTQFNRNSMASSDGRPSFQEDDDGYLVEESLVVDDHAVFERCFQHLNDFATEGLRTLMYASRFLDEASYTEWKQAYQEASTSLVDRQAKIEKVGEQIEMQLELVGATAIEDKLQKGVPEAIDKLRRANIKLWMLTGDKRETAINIGHSCRLVKEYSELIILDHEAGDVERTIVSTINSIRKGRMAHSVLVIDGQTLSIIEGDAILMPRFFKLAIMVDSVICCRASPKQKAFLVKSVRKHVLNAITLAIGDGANDIAMIQEAHVGIGITGKEGLQAARISDYSIAQFRFLLKLLLVHGRWNYNRICKYTLGTFWKEMLFYLTQALFQHYNGYTGTSLYENWSLSMFNTLFTSLAVIFLGVLEKDLSASTLLAVPELYTKGQRNQGFNIRIYLGWALMAVIEAVIVFYTMYGLFGQSLMGIDNTIFPMGLLTFTACVTIINLKLQFLEIHYKTIVSAIVLIVSIGGWFLWNIILSTRYDDATSGKSIYDVHGNFLTRIGRSLNFWAVLFLIIASVLLFETTVTLFRQYFFPTDVDIFQHLERDPAIKRRFEEAAASELQQGWDRSSDKVKSSLEIARDEEEQLAREREVNEYLNRPRTTTDLNHPPLASRGAEIDEEAAIVDVVARSGSVASTSNNPRRKSHDIHDLFSKGFGSIKRGHL